MSVIAKMRATVHNFGTGRLIDLSCVCENDLMAAYAGSEEDKLFTKYSPWGEMKVHQPDGWCLASEHETLYVIILKGEEVRDTTFPGSRGHCKARVVSVTDFGDGQAKRVEIASDHQVEQNRITGFNWKMSVDNPPVFDQLIAGDRGYWVVFYPADIGRDAAIQKAHGAV